MVARWALAPFGALALVAGCAAHAGPPKVEAAESTAVVAPAREAGPQGVSRPTGPLTLAEARRYMVRLINADRASMGLPPVELDEGPASRAGQRHAEDMARHGFLGHWGTDGSVPEQRATEAGGEHMVLENASCFVDEKVRRLDREPLIDPKNVEKAEEMFFHEVPPHDGHRKNILKPFHKRVGIGIAQPVATPTEIPVPCFAQEFLDPYGTYAAVPRRMAVGDTVHVEGHLTSPAVIAGVGLARVEAPKPLSAAEANRRRSYPVPPPYQMYWPAGFKTPIPLRVQAGGKFAIDIPLSDQRRPGMYELSVWAKLPGSGDFVMVGLRTIQVQ